jgi:hypothetical protein
MTRGQGQKSLVVVGLFALLAQPSVAPAQTPPGAPSATDAKKACIAQHESAQTFRKTGKLLEARDATLVCSRDECPGAIRSDCVEWLDLVSKTIPSLVVRAKLDDKDVFDVRVSIDGKLIKSHLDGAPFELNPGAHSVRFEYAGFDPLEQQILVLEGEKNRVVAANFAKAVPVSAQPLQRPAEHDAPAPVDTYRPTPVLTYVLGGVAVLGVAGFASFGTLGQQKKKDLESSCRPVCSDNDLQPVRTQFILADASLGLAIASTVVAGVLYFTRPAKPLPPAMSQGSATRSASGFAFGISPTASGAQFAIGTEF